jgi:hypothetical protein
MAVAFEDGNEGGEERHQTPSTDTIGGRPSLLQGHLYGGTIGRKPRTADLGGSRERRSCQQANGILAGIVGGGDKLIEDERLLGMGSQLVARRDLRQQLAFRPKAHS